MMFPSVLDGYYAMKKITDGKMVSIENNEYVWTKACDKAHKIVGKITCGEMSVPMVDVDVYELDANGKVVKKFWEHSGHTSMIILTLYNEEDHSWYKVVYEYEYQTGEWLISGDPEKTDEPVVNENIMELTINDTCGMMNIPKMRV